MKTRTLRAGALLTALTASLLLAACSSPATSLAGSWGEPETPGEPALVFTPDGDGDAGEYAGSDGCNTIGGSYTEADGTIELGVMRATMMYCEGVDTWLSRGHTAELSGDTLTVFDEAGTQIGALTRAAG